MPPRLSVNGAQREKREFHLPTDQRNAKEGKENPICSIALNPSQGRGKKEKRVNK